ncbi:MAG: class II fumarate hydratase [Pseudomonadota bacterium]
MSGETGPETRVERDSMGELHVPKDALWGAQTQRAVQNFPISGWPLPAALVRALGLIKATAAEVNGRFGVVDEARAAAIVIAADRIARGEFVDQFPVDVFQTGSGTSSNMNANEVIARLASTESLEIHPNDHVNAGQSSNDVFPTAIHVAACVRSQEHLLPALRYLRDTMLGRATGLDDIVKTGRTHLMDAMPVTFGQVLRAWAAQITSAMERIESALERLARLPQGGTAVGTGINAHPQFAGAFAVALTERSGCTFTNATVPAETIGAADSPVELSGQLKTAACALMKIANDLRWMNSGPNAGLGELRLPPLQPGSSIMPGKVNPVIPEAVTMVCAQVIGNDTAVTVGGQAGNFELNVMLPMIAHNLLASVDLLGNAASLLADRCIAGFEVDGDRVARLLALNPILVTGLNALIGYEKGATIAKRAMAEGRTVIDVALEETELTREELARLLDPARLAQGGIPDED